MYIKQWLKKEIFLLITKILGDNKGLVSLPVLRGPAKRLHFKLDLLVRQETSYFLGTYDLSILKQVVDLVQKGWIVWDCGAYIGFYTALFARLVGPEGKVVAFEPDYRNMTRLRENIYMNKFSNVQFIQVAITAPLGEVDFILSNNSNSHIPGTYVGASIDDYRKIERIDSISRVRCLSFNEAYSDETIPRPDLIKIDIDGAEKIALQHISSLVNNVRPIIILELHNFECDAIAWKFAKNFNYSLYSLDNRKNIQMPSEVHGTLLCRPSEIYKAKCRLR